MKGDMSWAHKNGPEWKAFSEESAMGGGTLLFGRVTYELMASVWPTPEGAKASPVIAEQMNNLSKVVFSRTLDKVSWKNTKLVKDAMIAEIRKMKEEPGDVMVIMGSGGIVSQLAGEGLIDEYQLVIDPLVLGQGRTMFGSIQDKIPLKLTKTRAFTNGNVVLYYEPAR